MSKGVEKWLQNICIHFFSPGVRDTLVIVDKTNKKSKCT